MIGYYDMVLGLVGTLLVGGAVASTAVGTAAIVVSALVAAAIVGHAMFVRPPMDRKKQTAEPAASYEVAD